MGIKHLVDVRLWYLYLGVLTLLCQGKQPLMIGMPSTAVPR